MTREEANTLVNNVWDTRFENSRMPPKSDRQNWLVDSLAALGILHLDVEKTDEVIFQEAGNALIGFCIGVEVRGAGAGVPKITETNLTGIGAHQVLSALRMLGYKLVRK